MTDDHPHVPRAKGRSASICATSMEAIPPISGTPDAGTPQSRRRRPAARSQSARLTNTRSVRRRTAANASSATTTTTPVNNVTKTQSTSEPKLADQNEMNSVTPDVSPNIRRKGSTRRGTSVYHRKSTAFLDVPDTRSKPINPEEEDEDSYRLRSFSFTSKGLFICLHCIFCITNIFQIIHKLYM